METRFIASILERRREHFSAPHATREGAAAELFAAHPGAKSCSVGYGYKGSFDVRTTHRADVSADAIADARRVLDARAFCADMEG